jgi:hypothetical protein
MTLFLPDPPLPFSPFPSLPVQAAGRHGRCSPEETKRQCPAGVFGRSKSGEEREVAVQVSASAGHLFVDHDPIQRCMVGHDEILLMGFRINISGLHELRSHDGRHVSWRKRRQPPPPHLLASWGSHSVRHSLCLWQLTY